MQEEEGSSFDFLYSPGVLQFLLILFILGWVVSRSKKFNKLIERKAADLLASAIAMGIKKENRTSLSLFDILLQCDVKAQGESQLRGIKIPLTASDLVNAVPLNLVWQFPQLLNHHLLIEALSLLLKQYPVLGGRIQMQFPHVFVQSEHPTIRFTVMKTKDSPEWKRKINRDGKNRLWENEKYFHEYVDDEERFAIGKEDNMYIESIITGYPAVSGEPVVKIRYINIHDEKSVLGISINHQIVDMSCIRNFITDWSNIYNLMISEKDLDFSKYPKGVKLSTPIHCQQSLVEYGVENKLQINGLNDEDEEEVKRKLERYHYRIGNFVKRIVSLGRAISSEGKCEVKLFPFYYYQIQSLKKQLMQDKCDGKNGRREKLDEMNQIGQFSTNDIISAVMWKAAAVATSKLPNKTHQGDQAFPLLFVVTGRNIQLPNFTLKDCKYFTNHTDGCNEKLRVACENVNADQIPNTYFGNCTYFCKIILSRNEVIRLPLVDLVDRIRDEIIYTRDNIPSIISALNTYHHIHGADAYLSLGVPVDFTGLFISNWLEYPLLTPKFGEIAASEMSIPAVFSLPNLGFIIKIHPEDEKVYFYYSASSSLLSLVDVESLLQ